MGLCLPFEGNCPKDPQYQIEHSHSNVDLFFEFAQSHNGVQGVNDQVMNWCQFYVLRLGLTCAESQSHKAYIKQKQDVEGSNSE